MTEAKSIDVNSPEFQSAVAAAAQAALADMMAKHGPSQLADGDSVNFMRQLAMEIAQLSDQGTNRKRVAPEVLAARVAARDRMIALILDYRAKGIRPSYRITSKIFFNETLVEPYRLNADKQLVPTEILWSGVPNDAMMPMDEPAKKLFTEYRASVGQVEGVIGQDQRPEWVTAGGLMVKGTPPARRQVVNAEASEPMTVPNLPVFDDVLDIKRPDDPRSEFVNVLGTIAPPARQTAPGMQ